MPKRIDDEVKAKAIWLRTEERLSLRQIAERMGLAKSTLSLWLKDHPLTDPEKHQRMAKAGRASSKARRAKAYRATARRSALHSLLGQHKPTRAQRARTSEAAVLVRLAVVGWEVYGSPFDGDKFDWIVNTGDRLVRIQVKTTRLNKAAGSPFIQLRCSEGRGKSRKYREGEFDFIVGYDLFTDTAYVWSWEEVKGRAAISVTQEAAEAWGKIKG